MLTVAHIADLHLGSFLGHGPVGSDGVPLRLRDQVRTWVQAAQAMVDAEVDMVAFCGDGFRSPIPPPTAIDGFIQGLQVLRAADIPVLMTVGNHDFTGIRGEVSALDVLVDEGVTCIREPRLEMVLGQFDDPICQVVALPYFWRSNLLAQEPDLTREQADARCAELAVSVTFNLMAQSVATGRDVPTIAMVHHLIEGATVGASGFGNGRPDDVHVPLAALSHGSLAYVAAGHIHKAQNVTDRIRYCGSPHPLDFSEEHDPKSWTLVSWDSGWSFPTLTEVPTHYRPLQTLDVDLTEVEDPTLLAPLRRQLEAMDWHGLDLQPIVRVRYKCRRDQEPAINRAEMLRLLRSAGAWHVTGLQSTLVDSGQVVRVEGLSATLDPVEIARKMLEAEGYPEAEFPDVLTKARQLHQEVLLNAKHANAN